jgi:hypothetical protein
MKAAELKAIAKVWLRRQYPEAHILEEFSVAEYGGALVDVAAICEDQIVGVEIKGDGDSAARLKLQGQMYSRVCRTMYLLPSPDLLKKCDQQKPPEWEMLRPPGAPEDPYRSRLVCADSGIQWGSIYAKKTGPYRATGYGLAPAALAAMLWTTEYGVFKSHIEEKAFTALPHRKSDFIRFVSGRYSLDQLEPAVCRTLRARTWLGGKVVDRPSKPEAA